MSAMADVQFNRNIANQRSTLVQKDFPLPEREMMNELPTNEAGETYVSPMVKTLMIKSGVCYPRALNVSIPVSRNVRTYYMSGKRPRDDIEISLNTTTQEQRPYLEVLFSEGERFVNSENSWLQFELHSNIPLHLKTDLTFTMMFDQMNLYHKTGQLIDQVDDVGYASNHRIKTQKNQDWRDRRGDLLGWTQLTHYRPQPIQAYANDDSLIICNPKGLSIIPSVQNQTHNLFISEYDDSIGNTFEYVIAPEPGIEITEAQWLTSISPTLPVAGDHVFLPLVQSTGNLKYNGLYYAFSSGPIGGVVLIKFDDNMSDKFSTTQVGQRQNGGVIFASNDCAWVSDVPGSEVSTNVDTNWSKLCLNGAADIPCQRQVHIPLDILSDIFSCQKHYKVLPPFLFSGTRLRLYFRREFWTYLGEFTPPLPIVHSRTPADLILTITKPQMKLEEYLMPQRILNEVMTDSEFTPSGIQFNATQTGRIPINMYKELQYNASRSSVNEINTFPSLRILNWSANALDITTYLQHPYTSVGRGLWGKLVTQLLLFPDTQIKSQYVRGDYLIPKDTHHGVTELIWRSITSTRKQFREKLFTSGYTQILIEGGQGETDEMTLIGFHEDLQRSLYLAPSGLEVSSETPLRLRLDLGDVYDISMLESWLMLAIAEKHLRIGGDLIHVTE